MVYGRLKTATGPSEKFEYRSPVDLGIGDAMYRRPCDFHLRALEGSPQPNSMVHAAQVRSYIFWIDWFGNSHSNEPTADAWSSHWVRCIDKARE
jgi:hypothetical protein